ncbi:MAG: hypothetical protein MJ067_06595 [Oscillospiraceae bacterium]|nr:hypothetical protein [Oscillospiraceae bacterium]
MGYFLPMILGVILSIVFAKSKGGWIWLAIASALQFVSILGTAKRLALFGLSATSYWTTFTILLLIGVVGFAIRKENGKEKQKDASKENNIANGNEQQ